MSQTRHERVSHDGAATAAAAVVLSLDMLLVLQTLGVPLPAGLTMAE